MKRLTAIASLIVLLLGGLYLYMNRFDYLEVGTSRAGNVSYLRINKLTGHKCYLISGDGFDAFSGYAGSFEADECS